jgi:hypothetical protein
LTAKSGLKVKSWRSGPVKALKGVRRRWERAGEEKDSCGRSGRRVLALKIVGSAKIKPNKINPNNE